MQFSSAGQGRRESCRALSRAPRLPAGSISSHRSATAGPADARSLPAVAAPPDAAGAPPDRCGVTRASGADRRPADERDRAAARGRARRCSSTALISQRPARARPHRGRHRRIGAAIKRQVVEVFGQRKLLKWSRARRRALLRVLGLPHPRHGLPRGLRLAVQAALHRRRGPLDWAIPIVGHWALLGFLQDFIAVMALFGLVTFGVDPAAQRTPRTSAAGRGSSARTSVRRCLTLFMIFNVIWTMFLFRGAVARRWATCPTSNGAFVSIGVGNLLDGLQPRRARGARGRRPAAAHRRDAGLPDLRAELQAPAHLPGAAQRAVRARPGRAGRGQADDVRRQAAHPGRPRGPRRGRQARRRRGRGLQLEGHARLRDLHRVRSLPVRSARRGTPRSRSPPSC